MDDELTICDFCNLALSDDEALHPVYIGRHSGPDKMYLTATVRQGDGRIESESAAMNRAAVRALREDRNVDVQLQPLVREVDTGPEEIPLRASNEEVPSFDEMPRATTEVKESMVGAQIEIRPEFDLNPSMMLCPNCVEVFKSE